MIFTKFYFANCEILPVFFCVVSSEGFMVYIVNDKQILRVVDFGNLVEQKRNFLRRCSTKLSFHLHRSRKATASYEEIKNRIIHYLLKILSIQFSLPESLCIINQCTVF